MNTMNTIYSPFFLVLTQSSVLTVYETIKTVSYGVYYYIRALSYEAFYGKFVDLPSFL